MSINSSLVKLADKIDADNKSNVEPEYKNPNNSIEKSLERIADNYSSSGGGGGGGVMIVTVTDDGNNMTLSETWKSIWDVYKTGERVVVLFVDEESIDAMQKFITELCFDDGNYYVDVDKMSFKTDSENGYPTIDLT